MTAHRAMCYEVLWNSMACYLISSFQLALLDYKAAIWCYIPVNIVLKLQVHKRHVAISLADWLPASDTAIYVMSSKVLW
jgi:hypothetical protein